MYDTLKNILKQEELKDVKIVIIDPEKEYSNIINEFSGEIVCLDKSESSTVNPLNFLDNDYFKNPFTFKETILKIEKGGFENILDFIDIVVQLKESDSSSFKKWWLEDSTKKEALNILSKSKK